MEDTLECGEALRMAHSIPMKIVLVLKIIVCLAGPIMLTWHIKTTGTSWLVHPNAKLIYRVHLFFTAWVSIFFILVHSLDLLRLSVHHTDPCDYRVSVVLSVNLRIIPVIGIFAQILTIVSLAIERLVASGNLKRYEKVKTNILAKVLVFLSIFFSVAICYLMLTPHVDWSTYNVGFVLQTDETKKQYQILIWCEVAAEICGILIFQIVIFLNSSMRDWSACTRVEHNLSSKYQISENQKICHHLLPVIYTHFLIFFITSMGIAAFHWVFPSGDETQFAIFLEIMTFTPFYACFMPVIVNIRAKYRRKRILRSAQRGKQSHFQTLTELAKMNEKRQSTWGV